MALSRKLVEEIIQYRQNIAFAIIDKAVTERAREFPDSCRNSVRNKECCMQGRKTTLRSVPQRLLRGEYIRRRLIDQEKWVKAAKWKEVSSRRCLRVPARYMARLSALNVSFSRSLVIMLQTTTSISRRIHLSSSAPQPAGMQ